mmetsp:Transcript_101103/g.291007  ORF Transcript_101103/g.291007 Transcript_101103/m.291007 type:complete len:116 (-) Transcript_101103:126-473(-)
MSSASAVGQDQFWIKSVAKERILAARSEAIAKAIRVDEPGDNTTGDETANKQVSQPLSARSAFTSSNSAYGALARTGYIALLPGNGTSFVYDGYDKVARRRDPFVTPTMATPRRS